MSVGGCLHEAVEGRLCKGLWKTVQLAVQRLPEWCEHWKKEERERETEWRKGKQRLGDRLRRWLQLIFDSVIVCGC